MKNTAKTIIMAAVAAVVATSCLRSQKDADSKLDSLLDKSGAVPVATYTEDDGFQWLIDLDSLKAEYRNIYFNKDYDYELFDSLVIYDDAPTLQGSSALIQVFTSTHKTADSSSMTAYSAQNSVPFKRINANGGKVTYYITLKTVSNREETVATKNEEGEIVENTRFISTDRRVYDILSKMK